MAFAEHNGLNVVAKLREKRFSKKPQIIAQFSIRCWRILRQASLMVFWRGTPDRLARNMLESGKIIDLLDNGIICDLKFPMVAFTSDASGKNVLLGMMFVMSKQYSEHLSERSVLFVA